ncbi:MAG: histidine kinase [Bacteroidota bacterium]
MSILFGYLSIFPRVDQNPETVFLHSLLINFIYISVIWNVNLLFMFLFDRKFEWNKHLRFKLFVNSIVAICLPVCVHILFSLAVFPIVKDSACQLGSKENLSYLIVSVSITLLVNSIFVAIEFFQFWKKSLLEKEELKRNSISAEFETLKNQINPHFLFNSLNTLSSLIDENPKTANEFVQKLSSVYRYVLTQKDKETVSLREELNFIESYLYLNKIRFGENLTCKIDVADRYLENKMATLTLQMLIENCIKHNVISQNKPLQIEIGIEGDFVVVKNNLQPKMGNSESNGIGLSNIIHRYKLLGKEEVEVIENGLAFIVKIPMI